MTIDFSSTLNIDLYRIYKPTKIIQEKQFNSYILAADKEKREEYSSKLKERIESLQEDEISWENVANHITEAAKEVVGFRTSNKNNRQNNSGVQKLSEEQKKSDFKYRHVKIQKNVRNLS